MAHPRFCSSSGGNRVRALVPQLQADLPPTVRLINAVDRTLTIRASVHEVQRTLGLSVLLVILVVFVFFRTLRTALIPITLSLLAVFIPILLMGGIFGRLFREFAVTLAVAVSVSLVVSLTTTPMMCAYLLRAHSHEGHGWLYRTNEWLFQSILRLYEITLGWVLRLRLLWGILP